MSFHRFVGRSAELLFGVCETLARGEELGFEG
jgi:hypothetical protein